MMMLTNLQSCLAVTTYGGAAWAIPLTVGMAALLAIAASYELRRRKRREAELAESRARVQNLERILQIAARIHATRTTEQLLEDIAEAVRKSLGFAMVLLRIYSAKSKLFEARAFAGIDDQGKEYLSKNPVSREDFQKMAQPCFRVSNSYLILHRDEGWNEAVSGGYVPDLGVRADDEWNENDMLIVPLTSPDGEIVGYLSVDDPIDRMVPGPEVIRQLELFARQAATAIASAELYSQLHQQNAELARTAQQSQQLNDMKSDFVANVSHELRTPLTSIKAYSEALCRGGEMDEASRNEFLEVIHQESEKLAGIIDNLLDLSRMEAEQVTINRHQTDLVALVRGIEVGGRSQAESNGVNFSVAIDRDEVRLAVDPDLVRQLIRHLLDNAFKFTPIGGEVRLSLMDGITSVRLCVEDTGTGIPANKMAYIFDRFYQVDSSSTREHGGQGIGLSLCRDIVTRHGGRIWGESVQPHGMRFNVVLPRQHGVIHRSTRRDKLPVFGDPQEFAGKLIHWIGELLRVRIVSLMVPESDGQHLVIEAAMGLEDTVVQKARIPRGKGVAGKVWESGETMLVTDVSADDRLQGLQPRERYDTGSLLSVPLRRDEEIIGVLNVNNRLDGNPFTPRDKLLIEAVASRLGHILYRAAAYQHRSRDFAALRESLRTGVAIRRARYDHITEICHEICVASARKLGMKEPELADLAFALQTYDLGLSGVPDAILYKTSPLTQEEWETIKQHVLRSLELVAPLDASAAVRQIILHHHEHYDGTGYPDGLGGEDIPLGSRMLVLVDGLNAMLQGRPYRRAVSLDDAIREIEDRTGAQFCPRCAEVFVAEAKRNRPRIATLQKDRSLNPAALGYMPEDFVLQPEPENIVLNGSLDAETVIDVSVPEDMPMQPVDDFGDESVPALPGLLRLSTGEPMAPLDESTIEPVETSLQP